MKSTREILRSIQTSNDGLTLADLLARHPDLARRTVQRMIARLIDERQVTAVGEGRARRYFRAGAHPDTATYRVQPDGFPDFIPLSADSLDIVAYIDQPLEVRRPVGYQRDFLDAYRPNATWYLSESLRRQLRKMGQTAEVGAPAGTYSRAILDRLLIDLSWASSHLEGNTYTTRYK